MYVTGVNVEGVKQKLQAQRQPPQKQWIMIMITTTATTTATKSSERRSKRITNKNKFCGRIEARKSEKAAK